MLEIYKKYSSLLLLSVFFRIFVRMEEDKILIERLLNHDKQAWEEFYGICKTIVGQVIYLYKNNILVKEDFVHEFYLYIYNNPTILSDFRGTCKLNTYLYSVSKYYFSSYMDDYFALDKGAKKERQKEEKRLNSQIEKIGDDPLFHIVSSFTKRPTTYHDEDEEAEGGFFLVEMNEKKKDDVKNNEVVIIGIDEIMNISAEENVSDKCKLVRLTLDKIPARRALVLRKLYFEGKDRKEIALELGMTMGALYNLIKNAKHSFVTSFNNLKNLQNEEN